MHPEVSSGPFARQDMQITLGEGLTKLSKALGEATWRYFKNALKDWLPPAAGTPGRDSSYSLQRLDPSLLLQQPAVTVGVDSIARLSSYLLLAIDLVSCSKHC